MNAPAPEPARASVIGRIADHLIAQKPGQPLRVAVDGITAAGKTTVARELAAAVSDRGRSSFHLSIDGFHHPSAHRYRQGRDSALGYYADAYDFESFARLVLRPLGPGGDHRYRTAVLDLATDERVDDPSVLAPDDLVLVVDGSFLQRSDLAGHWDQVVFVDTSFEAAQARGTRRDAARLGGLEQAEKAFIQRYHAASRIYLDEVEARASASIVLRNDQVEAPVLARIGGPASATVRLFSYGTLQQPQVQRSSFGRLLDGTPDTLPGHRQDLVTITDPDVIAASGSNRHPIVRPTAEPANVVEGTVFTITTGELAAADHYEVDDYRRVLVNLTSGTEAWVYLAHDRT
jgi:uridine kinase